MENNKINEIGKKLDIDTSVIVKERIKDKKKKILYIISNALNFVLSCTLGGFLGYSEFREITGYPFLNNNNMIGLFGVSLTNFLNGGFTFSQRFNSVLNKKKKRWIFIVNFFMSIIAYITIFANVAYSNGHPGGIMYNVYDSSKKKQK